MKPKLVLLCIVAAIYPLFSGCSTDEGVLRVSCDDFYSEGEVVRDMKVPAGCTFKVSLCSKPSTTLEWTTTAAISDETLLEQTGHKFVMSPPGGTSGQEIWLFRALKEGTGFITIKSDYSPGINNESVWKLVLQVTVG
jgi:predicted secreted protein